MPDFDPYHRWLGITPDEQPPTPHRLLGIAPDETDKETIRRAALQRNAFIRDFSLGEQGKIAERLLNEIAAARDVILAAIKQPAVETPSPVETPFEPDEENTDPAVAPTAQAPNSIPQEPVIPAIHIAVENSHTQLDAYYEWLGILPDEQPASHYRLLAIQEFESNASIINDAAERRFILLRQFQPGPDAELAEDLLNEVARARNCLLDVHSKAKYDQQLKDIRQPDQLAATEGVPEQNPTPLARPLQQKLVEARNVEPTSIYKKQFIKLGFAVAGVVVALLTGMIIKAKLSTEALETAIAKRDWQAALEIDPNSSDGLRLKAAAERAAAIEGALAKGDWQAALEMDPNSSEGLRLKAAAEQAFVIKTALAKGDWQTVLRLNPSNSRALALKANAERAVAIKDALAKGDWQAALEMDPNSRGGIRLKAAAEQAAAIKDGLAKGDWKTVLELDPNNNKALTLRAAAVPATPIITLTGHGSWVNSVAFSPDGKTIASGSYDKTVKLWDSQNGAELKTLTGYGLHRVFSVAFSPDGKTIASASYDKTVKLWDSQSGAELKTLTGHDSSVNSVAFSADGKTIASGSADQTVKLWDSQSGAKLKTLTGHEDWVYSVAFSPDSKTIASGSADQTIRLWDSQSGKELKTLTGHEDWVNSVAFSPDGKTIESGSADQTIKLWDVSALAAP